MGAQDSSPTWKWGVPPRHPPRAGLPAPPCSLTPLMPPSEMAVLLPSSQCPCPANCSLPLCSGISKLPPRGPRVPHCSPGQVSLLRAHSRLPHQSVPGCGPSHRLRSPRCASGLELSPEIPGLIPSSPGKRHLQLDELPVPQQMGAGVQGPPV